MEQEAVVTALEYICEYKNIKYDIFNCKYMTCENNKSHIKLYSDYVRYSTWGAGFTDMAYTSIETIVYTEDYGITFKCHGCIIFTKIYGDLSEQ